jgi:integrase
MAEVFRPVYYADPATGKAVKKSFPGAVKHRSPTWWIRYYTPDGQRHKVKGYPDKKATETKAAELERRGIRLAAGIVDPTEEYAKKPLADHAEDFRRYLTAKGNTASYVQLVLFRLTAVLDGCHFIRIADVQTSTVLSFISELRDGDKSLKTVNEYLAAVKSFTRWLWRDRRVAVDPLAGLPRLAGKGEADIRHARRDFSSDELRRLLETARRSPKSIRCLPGIDRYFLYLTACATGFRAGELASMTPESFDLDGDRATVRVASSCTKNRREAIQPLPADVAKLLADYLRDKPSGAFVWPGKWAVGKAVFMIRADLKTARETWLSEALDDRQREERKQSGFLAYCDSQGRYTDFHALRHSYITMVGKMGVSPREHQDLARHSTYSMTARYTHSRAYDLAAAVQGLPIPTDSPERTADTLAATGTDGKYLGPFLGPKTACLSDKLRQPETIHRGRSSKENPEKQAVLAAFRGSDKGTSKMEAAGIEPASRGTSAPASTCVASLFRAAKTLRSSQLCSPRDCPSSRVETRLSGREI